MRTLLGICCVLMSLGGSFSVLAAPGDALIPSAPTIRASFQSDYASYENAPRPVFAADASTKYLMTTLGENASADQAAVVAGWFTELYTHGERPFEELDGDAVSTAGRGARTEILAWLARVKALAPSARQTVLATVLTHEPCEAVVQKALEIASRLVSLDQPAAVAGRVSEARLLRRKITAILLSEKHTQAERFRAAKALARLATFAPEKKARYWISPLREAMRLDSPVAAQATRCLLDGLVRAQKEEVIGEIFRNPRHRYSEFARAAAVDAVRDEAGKARALDPGAASNLRVLLGNEPGALRNGAAALLDEYGFLPSGPVTNQCGSKLALLSPSKAPEAVVNLHRKSGPGAR